MGWLSVLVVAVVLLAAGCGGATTDVASGAESTTAPTGVASTTETVEPTAEAPTLAQWAADACIGYSEFATALSNANGGIDPTTLPLDERIALGIEASDRMSEAAEQWLSVVSNLDAPSEGRDYNAALVRQAEGLVDLFAETSEMMTSAVSLSDIEAVNALTNMRAQELDAAIREAASELSPEALAALQGPASCRQLPR